MRIAVLALDGVFDTGLAAILDTLRTAIELGWGSECRRIDVSVVGVSRKTVTAHGLLVPSSPASGLSAPDVVIVPAIGAKTADTLPAALADREIGKATGYLRLA